MGRQQIFCEWIRSHKIRSAGTVFWFFGFDNRGTCLLPSHPPEHCQQYGVTMRWLAGRELIPRTVPLFPNPVSFSMLHSAGWCMLGLAKEKAPL